MSNVVFNSIRNAIAFEKSTQKTVANLIKEFVLDIEKSDVESIKKSLKTELKKSGFVPSNCFSTKVFNTATALSVVGIKPEDSVNVMQFCKIKASFGEKMTEKLLAQNIEKFGTIEELIKQAKEACTPQAKKASRKASAKKGAQTRSLNKGGTVVPQAVRDAAQTADSANAAAPTQSITPAAKIDRAVNTFLALTDDERAAFINAVKSEINATIAAVNAAAATKTKAKKEKENAA